MLDKIGLKAQDTAELFFDDVGSRRPTCSATPKGQGFIQLMEQLPQERLVDRASPRSPPWTGRSLD